MNRTFAYLTIFGVGGLIWWQADHRQRSEPPKPRLTSTHSESELAIAFWQNRVRQDPGAIATATLASAYYTRFREQGDEADLILAESAARRSLATRRAGNAAALTTLAQVRLSRHDFSGALSLAEELERIRPRSATARNLQAECALELGRYHDAERVLANVARLHPHEPYGMTLRARWLELTGRRAAALTLYKSAMEIVAKDSETPPSTVAWFQGRVAACLFQLGRYEDSLAMYNAAVTTCPTDTRVMEGLAYVLLCTGKTEEARRWLDVSDSLRPVSQTSAILRTQLAEVEGDTKQARTLTAAIADETGLSHAHGRALALFLADHGLRPEEAVRLATADLSTRGDLYTFDTLAWAYFSAGRFDDARVAIQRALKPGGEDALIFYHAGRIYEALGETALAQAAFGRALQLNAHFHPTHAADCAARKKS